MRRIDKMTAEQVADFFAGITGCDVCPVYDKSKERCRINDKCDKNLRDYLLQDMPMKKRFQTYESMKSAFADFTIFCSHNSCSNCSFYGEDSCLVRWLDAEIEVENDDR